jgi:hypothetical protein
VHEHSSPAADIPWDEEAVYADLSGPPNFWDRETIYHNVFRRYSASSTNFTDFDPHSVMLYEFPARWTKDRRTYPENITLSPMDERFAARNYRGRS